MSMVYGCCCRLKKTRHPRSRRLPYYVQWARSIRLQRNADQSTKCGPVFSFKISSILHILGLRIPDDLNLALWCTPSPKHTALRDENVLRTLLTIFRLRPTLGCSISQKRSSEVKSVNCYWHPNVAPSKLHREKITKPSVSRLLRSRKTKKNW